MVNYICHRCGYENKNKSVFKKHLLRKYICPPKLKDIEIRDVYSYYFENERESQQINYQKVSRNQPKINQKNQPKSTKINQKTKNNDRFFCNFCKKEFKHYQSLKRHEKYRCKTKYNNDDQNDLRTLVNLLNEQLIEKDKKLYDLQKEHNKQIELLIKKTGINIGTQNIQQNNNIKILAYNNSDISHLTDKDYLQILNKGSLCVPKLLEAIHFNPQKPENHNIYIPNIKNNYVMMWNGQNWNLHNRDSILEEMYENKSNVLIDKIEEWIDIGFKLDPIIMKKFKRFLEKREEDEIKNKIKEEIKLILYNKRNLIDINKN